MKTNTTATTILLLAIAFLFTIAASADERNYVWTYQYMTMEKGEAELEHYLTFTTPDFGEFEGITTAEHQFELEFGMNDRFDFAIYQRFKQEPQGEFEYTGFKLRGRYRFGEKDQYFMDPLLYVEYKNNPDFSEHAVEVKFILAKDLGKFNIALNPYFEVEEGDDETEFTPKYAAAFSYKFHKLLRIGMEFKGSEKGHYSGPTVSHGGSKFFWAVGLLAPIGTVDLGQPEFQLRSIIGIKF